MNGSLLPVFTLPNNSVEPWKEHPVRAESPVQVLRRGIAARRGETARIFDRPA